MGVVYGNNTASRLWIWEMERKKYKKDLQYICHSLNNRGLLSFVDFKISHFVHDRFKSEAMTMQDMRIHQLPGNWYLLAAFIPIFIKRLTHWYIVSDMIYSPPCKFKAASHYGGHYGIVCEVDLSCSTFPLTNPKPQSKMLLPPEWKTLFPVYINHPNIKIS